MEKSTARKIAFYGVLSALTFVFLLIETYLFEFLFGNFTPAILTLPFAVAISLFNGKRGFWVGGTIFGCCSFFIAIMIGNVVFLNPLVSILPRIFIGIVAYFSYLLLKMLFKNAKSQAINEILPLCIAGALGILTNTICTVFMMWVFNASALAAVMTAILSFNFLAEVIGAIILVPVYANVFKRILKTL